MTCERCGHDKNNIHTCNPAGIIVLDDYCIEQWDNDKLFIKHYEGEGGTFDITEFEKAVDKFFEENF